MRADHSLASGDPSTLSGPPDHRSLPKNKTQAVHVTLLLSMFRKIEFLSGRSLVLFVCHRRNWRNGAQDDRRKALPFSLGLHQPLSWRSGTGSGSDNRSIRRVEDFSFGAQGWHLLVDLPRANDDIVPDTARRATHDGGDNDEPSQHSTGSLSWTHRGPTIHRDWSSGRDAIRLGTSMSLDRPRLN